MTPYDQEIMRNLHYDSCTGNFIWIVRKRGVKINSIAGTQTKLGYIQIMVCGKLQFAHRLAWFFTYCQWPVGTIDHIDGNPSNNKIENLRDVSFRTNQENQKRAHKSNRSSGLLGSSYDKVNNRWHAKISHNNRTINLGRFSTAQEAHQAYLSAKRLIHLGNTL